MTEVSSRMRKGIVPMAVLTAGIVIAPVAAYAATGSFSSGTTTSALKASNTGGGLALDATGSKATAIRSTSHAGCRRPGEAAHDHGRTAAHAALSRTAEPNRRAGRPTCSAVRLSRGHRTGSRARQGLIAARRRLHCPSADGERARGKPRRRPAGLGRRPV